MRISSRFRMAALGALLATCSLGGPAAAQDGRPDRFLLSFGEHGIVFVIDVGASGAGVEQSPSEGQFTADVEAALQQTGGSGDVSITSTETGLDDGIRGAFPPLPPERVIELISLIPSRRRHRRADFVQLACNKRI